LPVHSLDLFAVINLVYSNNLIYIKNTNRVTFFFNNKVTFVIKEIQNKNIETLITT